jgi:SAM-dependent methyltransferase
MPSVEENTRVWAHIYEWPDSGEEWSVVWGGSEAQWHGAILPRIHRAIPCGTILEIAPGFGRWTKFLAPLCQNLVLVDLSERCIAACRERFAEVSHVSYHVNDGRSLKMVPDRTIDFAFSFDSLVHAEIDVVVAYLEELAKKLTARGRAFLHHSNLGALVVGGDARGTLPPGVENRHWRSMSVSAEGVRNAAAQLGLDVLSQELVNWGCDFLSDAFTVVALADEASSRETQLSNNDRFMDEAALIAKWAPLYCRGRSQ